jgi:CheY-like chemotaxis protein/HPt (histidine-containing phosphotransfer) domain-containing protein
VDEIGTEDSVLLRFSIRDTGMGIPADRLDRLFTKFSQVDASTTRRFGGTGLGLAISKQLAEHMGGAIGVTSELDRGSEFWFTARLEPQATPGRETPPAQLGDARILVVDDNATSRDILSAQLTTWGLRATSAGDGPGALQVLAEGLGQGDPYRAILIDLDMPVMGGLALGRAVRGDPRFAALPLVLMVPVAGGNKSDQGSDFEFAARLRKPVRASELKKILVDCIVRGGAGSAFCELPSGPPGNALTPQRFEHCKVRVLVAEDSPTNQLVAVGILERLGLSADVVANGADAVKAVETGAYDVVLMDVQMPELDGLQAAQAIRRLGNNSDRPAVTIIAVTAHAMRGDAEACFAAGMDDYIAKPLSPSALARILERWILRRSEGTRPTAARAAEPALPPHADTPDGTPPMVFDEAELVARAADDRALARSIVRRFLDDAPAQVDALVREILAGDTKHAESLAHTLKGAAFTIGGRAFGQFAGELESMARRSELGPLRARTGELRERFSSLHAALGASTLLADLERETA